MKGMAVLSPDGLLSNWGEIPKNPGAIPVRLAVLIISPEGERW